MQIAGFITALAMLASEGQPTTEPGGSEAADADPAESTHVQAADPAVAVTTPEAPAESNARSEAREAPTPTQRAQVEDDHSHGPGIATVASAQTFVFELPDIHSNVLRRLYVGEVVHLSEAITTHTGGRFAKIQLGPGKAGYVESARLAQTEELPVTFYEPESIVRDERPIGVAVRSLLESSGAGLNFRYLPFSRLGLSFNYGAVVRKGVAEGTILALGVVSYLSLSNLSPIIEIGFSRLSRHRGNATLRVSSFYTIAGAEWTFDMGLYIAAYVTYLRSLDAEVAYEYEDARVGNIDTQNFGSFEPGEDNQIQTVLPGASIGYAF